MDNIIKRIIKEAIVSEGRNDIDVIDKITSDIIIFFAKKNYPIVNRISKRNNGDYHFNQDSFRLSEFDITVDSSLLQLLMDNNLNISFAHNIETSYFQWGESNSFIKIKHPSKEFIDSLNYNISVNKDIRDGADGSFDKATATNILRSSLGVAYRSTITHELQHAFDAIKSNGKYGNNVRSKKHYASLTKSASDDDFEFTPQQYENYLNLPHEYWARFSEYVVDAQFKFNKPFDALVADFKNSNIIKFDRLRSQIDKERLIKALYKIWDSRQKK